MKFFEKWKLTKKIPRGPYCYSGHLGKNRCKHYSFIDDSGIKIPHCNFLNISSIDGLDDFSFCKLVEVYKSKESLYNKYPVSLLFDQVKECGIKL